ncbi:MAG: DEAD/DEAH box helicase [Planctomycetales bacterium]|nr:DEAD/DEAH box helicase [Planctomycetales bacterium]
MATTSKSRRKIGIRDRLGRLTYRAVCRLLGDEDGNGEARLRKGAGYEIDIANGVFISGDSLRVTVQDPKLPRKFTNVTFVEMTNKPKGLQINCEDCQTRCDHVAAAMSLILEEKLTLGLAAPPDPSEPVELLTEDELVARALADRAERAEKEQMLLRSHEPDKPWTDYTVTSRLSGKSYRVSLRGMEIGESYCSCPDFRTNHLGTCKHILHALTKVRKRFAKKELARSYRRAGLSLRLDYGKEIGLRFNVPRKLEEESRSILGKLAEEKSTNAKRVVRVVRDLEKAGCSVNVYPDAEEFIESKLLQDRISSKAEEIRSDVESHPLRTELLNAELLPYQLDGIAFAAGAGRAILADDMGLGKTIQGIGVAELLAQLAEIKRVLVVCPASLKSQWRSEISRFCQRDSQIVIGSAEERTEQYENGAFFTICNYEQVLRDHAIIERIKWDLIILDEGQRIKNWESKTSRLIKSLSSQFALVLSGTPLENRLEELYTVVGFIDDQRLGPAYRFFHRHRIVDERGRVEGYKNLDDLRETLKPILLRRTRDTVMKQLPERTTEIVRIRPTEEQQIMSDEYAKRAGQIAAKKFLTELDLLRIQKYLLFARMAANSTFLVDKETHYSTKLERLEELLGQLAEESDRKIVLFSEWTTMLNLIEPLIAKHGGQFVRLDGKVPQQKRQQLVHQFQTDPNCRVILMSNAGTTGLNLQAANTVINVDLPWNPAVLEQRVARAHRMGQQQPVHVYLLVTEQTIEERMLGTLSAKHDLAMAALDVNSNVDMVELRSGIEELRSRLERLIGKVPPAPIDASEQLRVEADAQALVAKRERVAAASGELLGAALSLVGELIDTGSAPNPEVVDQVQTGLANLAERDAEGRLQLRLTLKDDGQLRNLAQTLAKLLVTGGE